MVEKAFRTPLCRCILDGPAERDGERLSRPATSRHLSVRKAVGPVDSCGRVHDLNRAA